MKEELIIEEKLKGKSENQKIQFIEGYLAAVSVQEGLHESDSRYIEMKHKLLKFLKPTEWCEIWIGEHKQSEILMSDGYLYDRTNHKRVSGKLAIQILSLNSSCQTCTRKLKCSDYYRKFGYVPIAK